jgi:hypothetical protein
VEHHSPYSSAKTQPKGPLTAFRLPIRATFLPGDLWDRFDAKWKSRPLKDHKQ